MELLNCVILAAGKGTRMRSKTPKIAHPIMGRPMIRYVVETAQSLLPQRVVVVTGHGKTLVEDCLDGAGVAFAHQAEQKGTAHALLTAEDLLGPGDILVLYGDVPLIRASTLHAFIESFRKSEGIAFMTTEPERPDGYGRVILDDSGRIIDIVEESEATDDVRQVRVINTGLCMIRRDLLPLVAAVSPDNTKGEYYLTDICTHARRHGITVAAFAHGDAVEVLGINTRRELLDANLAVRHAILDRHMDNGVTMADRSPYIEADVTIGPDTVISPYCYITGRTEIGQDVFVGPHVVIKDSVLEDGVSIEGFTSLDGVRAGQGAKIGPFTRIRPKTVLKRNVKIGNFVELKNATIGEGSKASHLSYIGDAEVGSGVNIGAGTITCNYDGKHKYRTTIEDGVFVGSNTELVAPVTVGKDAFIGAGSTITRDVPEGALAITRVKQRHIEGYSARRKKCAE
ncbi:MAG: bifunctional UDP-N-acetylglucosamine diphosphorylase/glucosamine-1-phosphate N-acetyltransferase GlmU [Syntrophorhabdales bacterium]|jgi:bifunctional UDP-N-acetylglucosamine pyrophosphorylase/glucosamine-1-phosphate N-acetyltransferase